MLEFWRRLFRRFDRRHLITADSAKTYGYLGHRTACRKTCDFPGRAEASLIGPLMACPGKRLRLRESGRYEDEF
jgi:hypothetical protein